MSLLYGICIPLYMAVSPGELPFGAIGPACEVPPNKRPNTRRGTRPRASPRCRAGRRRRQQVSSWRAAHLLAAFGLVSANIVATRGAPRRPPFPRRRLSSPAWRTTYAMNGQRASRPSSSTFITVKVASEKPPRVCRPCSPAVRAEGR